MDRSYQQSGQLYRKSHNRRYRKLITGDVTVMELAMKYGYDSPDSFTKAFTRFHGNTPITVRKNKTMIKAFAPLQLTISLKGGYAMDYRITQKEAFNVLAVSKGFSVRTIPTFTWAVSPAEALCRIPYRM